MLTIRKPVLSLYVERSSQRWIVRDDEGNFWILPLVANPWDARQPFHPTEETELEAIPGHYKYSLGIPA